MSLTRTTTTNNSKYIPPQKRKQLYDDNRELNFKSIQDMEAEKMEIKEENEYNTNNISQTNDQNEIYYQQYLSKNENDLNIIKDHLKNANDYKLHIIGLIVDATQNLADSNTKIQNIEKYLYHTNMDLSKINPRKQLSFVDEQYYYSLKKGIYKAISDKNYHISSCIKLNTLLNENNQILIDINNSIELYEKDIAYVDKLNEDSGIFYDDLKNKHLRAIRKANKSAQKKIDWLDSLINILQLDNELSTTNYWS